MRPNVKFANVSELILHKQATADKPVKCRYQSSADTLAAVCLFMLLLGMVLGVWLCQTYWR